MNVPSELKYSKEHEWVRLEGNIATIGITDFAQSELGDLVYIDIDTVGQVVKKDDVFGTVEAVKTTSDLFMPVTARVIEVNPAITESGDDNPGLINTDAYGEGWIIRAEIQDEAEFAQMLDASAYLELIG
ncbi:MAG TPA: glycine cleavage system protein GcvH [Saprospiraceae bacterium]|nr:glycine cleavage system protein GcvH [Saprospiraceae bacterium]HQW54553.1 glycine cleavage system protein GcvH [Saprospiraceae bacterium]